MTVKELIEKLQDIPENTPIYTLLTGYYDSEDGLLKLEGFNTVAGYRFLHRINSRTKAMFENLVAY